MMFPWYNYVIKDKKVTQRTLSKAFMVVVVFAVVGSTIILSTKAAPFTSSEEAESGVLLNATTDASAMASGGQYITFSSQSEAPYAFPGDPRPNNKIYWGASIGGNADPVARFESTNGVSLSVRRTFWQWDSHNSPPNDSLYNTVRDDLAQNRLPWVSTKTPPWNDVGAGMYDAEIDQLLTELNSYGKPIWLTFHHEPEGGGGTNSPDDPSGAAGWLSMQQRVRQRMNALATTNITFVAVLMSYTWDPASGRNPNDWWAPNIWDVFAVDHYRDNESGNMFTSVALSNFDSWATARNIPIAFGEWGNRGTDAQAGQEMRDFWEWGFTNNVVAYSYFDSGLNSPNGSWELLGSQLTTFEDILTNDSRVQRINAL